MRAEQEELEVLNLSHATRGSFGLEGALWRTDAGALYLAKHYTTDTRYTLREEVKGALAATSERERVQREAEMLQMVRGCAFHSPCVPPLLRRFQNDASLFWLFKV